jgi:hypothetical protein
LSPVSTKQFEWQSLSSVSKCQTTAMQFCQQMSVDRLHEEQGAKSQVKKSDRNGGGHHLKNRNQPITSELKRTTRHDISSGISYLA